jgi:hypothetical protein
MGTPKVVNLGEGHRDQKLKSARNIRFRQVQAAKCVIPYVLCGSLYSLGCRCCVLRGSLPPLIYPGGQDYMDLVNTSQGIVLRYNSSSFLLYRLDLSSTQTSRKQHK